jgi:hypothetical protein
MIQKRKGQALSLDMTSALVIFILLVSLLISFLVVSDVFSPAKVYDYELEYVFKNIERNLEDYGNQAFLSGSRIDTSRLSSFASDNDGDNIDNIVIGNSINKQGIGLDPLAYDTCLYFMDNRGKDPRIYEMSSGVSYLGTVKDSSGAEKTCKELMSSGKNPCGAYSDSISMMKPVLLDFSQDPNVGPDSSYTKNGIIQMNVVVCLI